MKTHGIIVSQREKRNKRDKKLKELNTKMNQKNAGQVKCRIKNDYFHQL